MPVLLISVDGLDHRYLRDANTLGLRIPHLRRLMREGEWTDGIIGVAPTVTWPSHTSLITGVRPDQHGILGNRRPRAEGGDYYWSASLLKAPTLWHATHAAGMKSAAITWPVTVDAQIDYNLPEYFQRRNGGAMDLDSIEAKATAGLVEQIARDYPSFPQEWMSDRPRALATMYLVRKPQPDLILVHFVDLDAEAHYRGPFTREANAILEYTDELIGQILAVCPKKYVVVVTSDHGFERNDQVVNLPAIAKGNITATGTLAIAHDPASADELRLLRKNPENGIGREIPDQELQSYAPQLSRGAAVFEPTRHFTFGSSKTERYSKPHEKGNHGYWPLREDYRSCLIVRGNGIRPGRRPAASMLTIASRLASLLGVELPRAQAGMLGLGLSG